LITLQGITNLKNSELRLAVIDRYRSMDNTIYDIINSTYPGYLVALNDSGIISMDFEVFCQDLEDTLESYGSFDPQDPFYTDTVDSRLFRALTAIMNIDESVSYLSILSEKSAAGPGRKDIHGMYKTFNSLRKTLRFNSNPESTSSEVALVAVSTMLLQFYEGDMIRRAIREAWLNKSGIIGVPTAATAFLENNSSTSAIVEGYVLENGGADITAHGIAWAMHFNPTTSNNTEIPDSQTGIFSVPLNGLTPGTTYYARTFATNSVGTGYGNCIDFVAAAPVGIEDKNAVGHDFKIHPNPASGMTTFSFQIESAGNITLTILDVKGQIVFKDEPGRLSKGENHVKLNLSGLADGIYTCRITSGKSNATGRLIIAH
jgi:hypothetical protein